MPSPTIAVRVTRRRGCSRSRTSTTRRGTPTCAATSPWRSTTACARCGRGRREASVREAASLTRRCSASRPPSRGCCPRTCASTARSGRGGGTSRAPTATSPASTRTPRGAAVRTSRRVGPALASRCTTRPRWQVRSLCGSKPRVPRCAAAPRRRAPRRPTRRACTSCSIRSARTPRQRESCSHASSPLAARASSYATHDVRTR
mmetsp:Transcript_10112/g.25199  ORF Transcript_10112/g.25199 Transcript_10112/m.25199 type:complete len:204 (+) Transcript_10112:563-1174(+)